MAKIGLLMQETGLDIVAVTETKISPDTRKNQIGIEGFGIMRKGRSSNGEGFPLYFKESFVPREEGTEGKWINILCQLQPYLIAYIYRLAYKTAF